MHHPRSPTRSRYRRRLFAALSRAKPVTVSGRGVDNAGIADHCDDANVDSHEDVSAAGDMSVAPPDSRNSMSTLSRLPTLTLSVPPLLMIVSSPGRNIDRQG